MVVAVNGQRGWVVGALLLLLLPSLAPPIHASQLDDLSRDPEVGSVVPLAMDPATLLSGDFPWLPVVEAASGQTVQVFVDVTQAKLYGVKVTGVLPYDNYTLQAAVPGAPPVFDTARAIADEADTVGSVMFLYVPLAPGTWQVLHGADSVATFSVLPGAPEAPRSGDVVEDAPVSMSFAPPHLVAPMSTASELCPNGGRFHSQFFYRGGGTHTSTHSGGYKYQDTEAAWDLWAWECAGKNKLRWGPDKIPNAIVVSLNAQYQPTYLQSSPWGFQLSGRGYNNILHDNTGGYSIYQIVLRNPALVAMAFDQGKSSNADKLTFSKNWMTDIAYSKSSGSVVDQLVELGISHLIEKTNVYLGLAYNVVKIFADNPRNFDTYAGQYRNNPYAEVAWLIPTQTKEQHFGFKALAQTANDRSRLSHDFAVCGGFDGIEFTWRHTYQGGGSGDAQHYVIPFQCLGYVRDTVSSLKR